MNKRPLSVTIICCLYIVTGVIGLAGQSTQFRGQDPFQYDIIGIGLVRLLAVVSGVFMLQGHNWARWLALA